MNSRMLAAHHEAGHVAMAWILGLPVGTAEVSGDGQGRTRLSLWYRSTSMFREVNQDTVHRDVLFVLAGDMGEQLLFPDNARGAVDTDTYLAFILSKRFCLNLRDLKEEASRMIVRQRHTINALAQLLYRRGTLNSFDLALLRMDWLARGKNLAHTQ